MIPGLCVLIVMKNTYKVRACSKSKEEADAAESKRITLLVKMGKNKARKCHKKPLVPSEAQNRWLLSLVLLFSSGTGN